MKRKKDMEKLDATSNGCGWRCVVCDERRIGRIEGDVGERWSVLVWGRGGWWVGGLMGKEGRGRDLDVV